MAGAVLGILAMLVWESGLIGSRERAPVPELPEDGVLLQVDCGEDYAAVQEVVSKTGAADIKTIEC